MSDCKMSGFSPYKLSCSLVGHSKDVRCLDSATLESISNSEPSSSKQTERKTGIVPLLVSGSRDFIARKWVFTPPKGFKEELAFAGHGNFVSSICLIAPHAHCEETLVATGCQDASIRLFSLSQKQPVNQLLGHTGNVSALRSGGSRGMIVSGSWDSSVKQWLQGNCVQTMNGHEAAVWDVELAKESETILSASADKTIKAWSSGKCVQTFVGHTDCVRGLAVISKQEFVSCANDATVRKWSIVTGDCLQVLYGHTNFIYSIKYFNGLLFTASEDKSVKIWDLNDPKANDPVQSLVLPAQSNWCLSVLPNGDFAVGCSDSSIRVFSNDPTRVAHEDELKAFSDEVATSSIPSKTTIGDLKIEELPGPEALLQPGRREGQTIMVKEGVDLAFCYQWSSAKNEWEKVGQVLGGSGGTQVSSGKQLHQGKEYDYVFSVKLDEDKDALKLPYNVTQDPWHVARQFILDNELDPQFLDQVANFIINNTKGVQLGKSMGNVDPFTGDPDAQFANSTPNPNMASSTSIPPNTPSNQDQSQPGFRPGSNMGNFDPYTGHSAMDETPSYSTDANPYFPLKDFLVLFKANFAKDAEKITEYNGKTAFKLSDESLQIITSVNANESSVDPAISDIMSCLLTWELEYIFPLFDICIHFAASGKFCKMIEPKINAVLQRILELRKSASKPSQTMAIRFLANLSGTKSGQNMLKNCPELSQIVESFSTSTINPVCLGLATLMLNISVLAYHESAEMSCLYLVPAFCQMLSREVLEEETCFRCLVAIGTIGYNCEVLKEACKGSNLTHLVENVMASLSSSPKVNDCSKKLNKFLLT